MSGTWSNSSRASHAVSEHSGKPISVINSKRLSSGLGLIVLRAARELENGATYEELSGQIEKWADNTKMYVSSRTIKYMVKSGRVSYTKGKIGTLLNLKPIVIVNNEGKTETFGKPFTEKASMKMIMKEITKKISNQKIWGYSISHAKNLGTAQWFADEMKKITGLDPEFINEASPVLGVNVGPGVVAVSVMF
jgi:DegV family protein with EDD domain